MNTPRYTWSTYPFGQFAWEVLIFVVVPVLVGALVVWAVARAERGSTQARPSGRGLPAWLVGVATLVAGAVAWAGWLSWTAGAGRTPARGPGLPVPGEYPLWQVVACGVTVLVVCWCGARAARGLFSGGLAAAVGTAAGVALAMCAEAATDTTGQSGVGVILAGAGWAIVLTLLMVLRGAVLGARRSRRTTVRPPASRGDTPE